MASQDRNGDASDATAGACYEYFPPFGCWFESTVLKSQDTEHGGKSCRTDRHGLS